MNQISKMVKKQSDINYDILRQIEEHAKGYETAVDKKEFLRNIGAYEQKLILLNSIKPYEVLCYMEQLDLPTTKIILSELSYDEIKKILSLFTTEDKIKFYTTFSELSLVNQFIVYDNKASEYIEHLSIDRKINLLNASDSDTVLASSKVYDTISEEDKEKVASSIQSSDGLSALSNSYSYDSSDLGNTNTNDSVEAQHESINLELQQELVEEQIHEEQQNKEEEHKPNEQNLELQEEMAYFRDNFENYKLENPELQGIDINNPDFYSLLSAELLQIVKLDYERFKKTNIEKKVVVNNIQAPKKQNIDGKNSVQNGSMTEQSSLLQAFQQIKNQTERELIQNLNEQIISNNLGLEEENTRIL